MRKIIKTLFIISFSVFAIIAGNEAAYARAKTTKKATAAKKTTVKKSTAKKSSAKTTAKKTPTAKDLAAIQAQIKKEEAAKAAAAAAAKKVDTELSETKNKMRDTASKIQANEKTLTKFEKMIADMKKQEAELESKLKYNNAKTAGVTAALQNLALYQKGAQFLQDKEPLEMVRASMLLAAVLPYLEKNANDFKESFAELVKVRDGIAKMYAETKSVTQVMQAERNNLKKLASSQSMEKERLRKSNAERDKRIKNLASQARNMEELMKKMQAEREREKAAAAKAQGKTYTAPKGINRNAAFYRARGKISMPAVGEVVELFGKTNKMGIKSKGIRLKTRNGAQVISPYDGSVVFAAPFKGYGNLIIFDNGDGYNTLLAGLGRIDVKMGMDVLAGEPVGQMDANSEGMYIEVRSNGEALDPLIFLKR